MNGYINENYGEEYDDVPPNKTYEEIEEAQKRLMEECEKLKNNGGNQNQQTNKDENVSTNP